MRVSSATLYNLLIKYERERSTTLTRKVEELSSGQSLLYPSDEPVDFARSLRLTRFSQKLERLNKNIDVVSSYLDTAESTLASAVTTLQDGRVKLIQLLNTGVVTQDEAETLSDYFKELRDYILHLGNEKVGDSYIFGGVKSQSPPFSDDGTYQGETAETTVPVAPGVELNTNFNGGEYFAVNGVSGKALAVEVMDRIREIIDSGELSRLQTDTIDVDLGDGVESVTLLEAYDLALSKMMTYRSIVGTKQQVAANLKTQNESMNLRLKELNSKLTDADYPQAIAELEKAKTAYEALMATVAQTKGLSLLNFLK